MTRSLTILLIACLAVNLALTSPGSPVIAASETTSASDLFDLDFPGGSLQEYVDAIRKQVRNANIIVMPEAMDITLPTIHLTSVDVGGSLAMLNNLRTKTSSQEIKTIVSYHHGNRNLGESDIYTINAEISSLKYITEVYSVREIIRGHVSDKHLLSLIESSLAALPEDLPAAKVQYHPETGVLIVSGYKAQTALISRLLGELYHVSKREQTQTIQNDASNSPVTDNMVMEMQKEINRLRESVSRLETENRILKLEMAKLKNIQDKE